MKLFDDFVAKHKAGLLNVVMAYVAISELVKIILILVFAWAAYFLCFTPDGWMVVVALKPDVLGKLGLDGRLALAVAFFSIFCAAIRK